MKKWWWFLTVVLFAACMADEDFDSPFDKVSDFNFESSVNNWRGGFANYSVQMADSFDLSVENTILPAPHQAQGRAMKLSARNYNGDLFMFVKTQVESLKPNQDYEISYEFVFVPQLIKAFGITNFDNRSVTFKTGAFITEPLVVNPEVTNSGNDLVSMNIDVGSFSQSNGDLNVMGNFKFANQEGVGSLSYFNSLGNRVIAKTDGNGKLWLLIGLETDLEVAYAIYFNRIIVYYKEI